MLKEVRGMQIDVVLGEYKICVCTDITLPRVATLEGVSIQFFQKVFFFLRVLICTSSRIASYVLARNCTKRNTLKHRVVEQHDLQYLLHSLQRRLICMKKDE